MKRRLNLHVYFHISSRAWFSLGVFVMWIALVVVLAVEQVRL